jgi:recombination protein RecT
VNAREAAARRAGREVATRDQGMPTPANESSVGATMRTMLERMQPELALALPKHMTPERMARQALTVFRTTKGLDQCSPQSFLGALMTCAQVGLEPGPQGHVYLIPFRNKGTMEATFILGYKGMMELARRSGELLDVSAHTVYQAEVDQGRFEVQYGTNGGIYHKPILFGDRGPAVGYYARATLKTGGRPFVVLSKAEVDKFRQRSATQRDNPSGPWQTDFEAMAWKTCIRRLSRWLPQSPELAAAMDREETVREVVPGQTVANVLETQPPVAADPDGIEDADPVTGEIPSGEGEAPPAEPPAPPYPEDEQTADPSDPDDPWKDAK